MASLNKNPAEGNAPEENKNTSVPEGKDEIYETLVGMLSEGLQYSFVFVLQLCALERPHILPSAAGRNPAVTVIGRLGILIRHLQENEIGQLFQIVAIGNAIIPKRITKAPDL